ncbi:hypothetical protein BB561_001371 [Smittium simulii]|uniref:FAD dependent oxidoreductase domain-containing protein n=1 Tax=Smittium simulii TaxID=133385 RepID=A0A2T9YV09_9FUNG|nr:hypothetical protein BB561_001371 [Smittium simulii]
MSSKKIPVVVVGAGIIGITTAIVLQKSGKYKVVVVSENIALNEKDLKKTNWASPFAGANWHAFAADDDFFLQKMEKDTLRELKKIADESPESGIKKTFCWEMTSSAQYKEPWYMRSLEGTRYLPRDNIAVGCDLGVEFSTVIINAPHYLKWMTRQFITNGGIIHRAKLDSLAEAADFAAGHLNHHQLPIIINCAALGNLYFSDVNDTKLHPIRGQVVLVNAPEVKLTITNTPAWKYVIPRGDGSVVIGGTYQKDNWSTAVDHHTTHEILRETVKFCPELAGETTPTTHENFSRRVKILESRIIKVNVGFRPYRDGGPRIEPSFVLNPATKKMIPVIHNYGHGGFGYQTSWAFAREAKRLADAVYFTAVSSNSKL